MMRSLFSTFTCCLSDGNGLQQFRFHPAFEGVFNKTETYKLYLAGHELKALISKED